MNESSPCRDIYQLKYKFSVPEFWKLKLALDSMLDLRIAIELDREIEHKKQQEIMAKTRGR